MNPLDWTAGPFLTLYAVLAITLTIVAALMRSRIGEGAARTPPLKDLEWAYLAGGGERLCDVALVTLAQQGAANLAAKGGKIEIASVSALQALAGSEISPPKGPISREAFSALMRPAIERTKQRLEALGLSPTDAQMGQFYVSVLPFYAILFGFGAMKLAIGLDRGHSIGILAMFLFFTIVAALALAARPKATSTGKAFLYGHQVGNARLARAPLEAELALAVALSGTTVLTGTAYAAIHANRPSSDGGGCGGGGCGGGGCGGCS